MKMRRSLNWSFDCSLSDKEAHLGHYSPALKVSLTFKVITKDRQKPIAGVS